MLSEACVTLEDYTCLCIHVHIYTLNVIPDMPS